MPDFWTINGISSWWFQPIQKINCQNGFIFPNFRGESSKHIWVATVSQLFIPQTDSPPWIVLFCNHPSSACRRDMEPRSQGQRGLGRFRERWKQRVRAVPYRDPSWPTAVVFHPPRFPWNFRDFLKTFHHHLGKIGRNSFLVAMKFDQIQSPKRMKGCTITLAKILSAITILSFGERSDRIIKNLLRTPKHPCVSYRFSHPKPLEGSGDILSAGAMCTQTGVICSGFGPLDRFSKKKVSAWRIIPASKWLIMINHHGL